MATVNLSGAVSKATSPNFIMSAVLIAAGSLGGQMFTDFARNNIVDVGMQGGDALYSLGGAVVVLAAPLPRKWSTPLASGMVASGALTTAREFNLV